MKETKAGIALAAYRPNLEFLLDQLRSIQQQTYQNFVCILTFDSPIPTPGGKEWAEIISDRRFRWIQNSVQLGARGNFQAAIQRVADEDVDVIFCADQDDVWYPDKLETSIRELAKHPPLSLVHSDMHLLRDGNVSKQTVWQLERRVPAHARPLHLLIRNIVTGASMAFDADLARRHPEVPEPFKLHDHWYAFVAANFGGVFPIDKPLHQYRQHSQNVVGAVPHIAAGTLLAHSGITQTIGDSVRNWIRYREMASCVSLHGLQLEKREHSLFFSRDFGFRFLLLTLRFWFSDRQLAMQSFAKALGKFITSRQCAPHE